MKVLKYTGAIFCAIGTIVYISMLFSDDSNLNSGMSDKVIILLLATLFGFLSYKLFKSASKKAPVNEINDTVPSEDTLVSEFHSNSTQKKKISVGFSFKSKEYQQKIEDLEKRNQDLQSMLVPEMQEIDKLNQMLEERKQEISDLDKQATLRNEEINTLNDKLNTLKQDIIETNEENLLQSFGLYKPKYDFSNSELYKDRLKEIRNQQKQMIKDKTAINGNMDWTVNGSKAQGKKLVSDMQKLFLRAYNTECDGIIAKVKFNTIETAEKRILTSKEAISKLGKVMSISISEKYYRLKLDELYLAYEYQLQKQEEKEEQKRIREELREEARLQKEIEEARKTIAKEQKHYSNALEKAMKQLESADETEKDLLNEKIEEIQSHLDQLDKDIKDVDYRAANQKAGYVYIISNIGSFGENIYKIGMTRRLDPMDRVYELGDASVPFNFDVHAMIFSENAPQLEAALHRAFENRKLNMVNTRREFFNVSLEEIKAVVKENFDKTVEFIDIPDAEQYRESLKIKELA